MELPNDRAAFWQQMLDSYEQRNLELAAKQRKFRDTMRNMKSSIPTDLVNSVEDICQSSLRKNPHHVNRLAPIPESCTPSICAVGQTNRPGGSNRSNLGSYNPCGYYNPTLLQSPGVDIRTRPDFSKFPSHSIDFQINTMPTMVNETHVCGLQFPNTRDVCQKFETMNNRLSERYKVLSDEIRTVKLELRNCVNQMECPPCRPYHEKCSVTLQTEPPKHSHRQEQTGPVCECTDFDDSKESVHQLTEKMQLLQCSCEELLEGFKQRRREPKYDICTKCAQGDHELVSMDNSLYGLARQLSKTLLDMEACKACKNVCPDVKDTVGYLKYLLDILHKFSERKAKPCSSARPPRPPPPSDPPKPCPCSKDAPPALPPPSPPPPPTPPPPPPPPPLPPPPCEMPLKPCASSKDTQVKLSVSPPPAKKPCVCHRHTCRNASVQIQEEIVSTGFQTEAPTTAETETGSATLFIIEDTLEAEEGAQVTIEEITEISALLADQRVIPQAEDVVLKIKSQTSVKLGQESTTVSETDVEINIDDGNVDVNVTFSIDDEGHLREIITEGPDGIVDSTLSYTESGNVTITTEVIDYEEILDATSEDIESLTTEIAASTPQERSKRMLSQQQEQTTIEDVDRSTSMACKDICRQRYSEIMREGMLSQQQEQTIIEDVDRSTSMVCKDICRQKYSETMSRKQSTDEKRKPNIECAYLRSLYVEQSEYEYEYDEITVEGLIETEGFETIFGEETLTEEMQSEFDQGEADGVTIESGKIEEELDIERTGEKTGLEEEAKGEYGEETVTEKESESDYGKDTITEGEITDGYDQETITEKASRDEYGTDGITEGVAGVYGQEGITEEGGVGIYGREIVGEKESESDYGKDTITEGEITDGYDQETITEKASRDEYGTDGITEGVAGVYGQEGITEKGEAGVYGQEGITEEGGVGIYGREAVGEKESESDYGKDAISEKEVNGDYNEEAMAEKQSADEFEQRGGEAAAEKESAEEFSEIAMEAVSITEKDSEFSAATQDVYGVSENLDGDITEKESELTHVLTGITTEEELGSPSIISSATIEEIEGIPTQMQISSTTFMSVSEVDQRGEAVGESESLFEQADAKAEEEEEKQEPFEETVETVPTSVAESELTIYEDSEAMKVSEAEVSEGVGVEEAETREAKVGVDTMERGICVDICKERAESAVHVVPSPVDVAEKGVCSDICKAWAKRSVVAVQSSTTDMVEKGICVDVCKKVVETGVNAVPSTEIYTTDKEVCVDICKKRIDTGMSTVSSGAIDTRGMGVCTDICRQMIKEPQVTGGVCSDICKRQAEAVGRASIKEMAVCTDICRQLAQAPETPGVCSDVCKQISRMLNKESGADVHASEQGPTVLTKEIGVCTDSCKEMAETCSTMLNTKDVGVCTDICKQLSEAQVSAVPSTVGDVKETGVCTDICRQLYQETISPSTLALEESKDADLPSEVGEQPEPWEVDESVMQKTISVRSLPQEDFSLEQELEGQDVTEGEAETSDIAGVSTVEEEEALTSEKTEVTDEGLISEAITGTAEMEAGRLETITELTETTGDGEGDKLELTEFEESTGEEPPLEGTIEEVSSAEVAEAAEEREQLEKMLEASEGQREGIELASEDVESAVPGMGISSSSRDLTTEDMISEAGVLAGKDEVAGEEYGIITEESTAKAELPLGEAERAEVLTEEERILAETEKAEALTEEERLLAATGKAEGLTEEEQLLAETGKAEGLTEEEQLLAETGKADGLTEEEQLLAETGKAEGLTEEERLLAETGKAEGLTEEELLVGMERAEALEEELPISGKERTHSELVRDGADYWKGEFEQTPPPHIERPPVPIRRSGSQHPCEDVCGRLYRKSGQTISEYKKRTPSEGKQKRSSVEKKPSYMDITQRPSCAYLQSVLAAKQRRSTKEDHSSESSKRPSRKSTDQEKTSRHSQSARKSEEVPTIELYVEPSDGQERSTSVPAQSEGERLPVDFFDDSPKPHPPNCDCFDCLCATCPDLQGICMATSAKSRTETEKGMTPEEKQLYDNIKLMDQSDLEKHIQETEEQYLQQKDQMMKLKDKIEAVRCMCEAAEVMASDSNPLLRTYAAKQKSAFHLTMSGLNLALSTLKNKCKQQDRVIDTITEELKLRTSNENVDDLLTKLGVHKYIQPSTVIATTAEEKQTEESLHISSDSTHPSSSYSPGEMPEMLFPLFKSLLSCPHSNFPYCDCVKKAQVSKPELNAPPKECDREVKQSKEEVRKPSFSVVSQSKLSTLHEVCSCTRPKCPIKTHINRPQTAKSAPKSQTGRAPKHPCPGRKDLNKDRSPTRPQTPSMSVDIHPKSKIHSLAKQELPPPFAVCKKFEAMKWQPLQTSQVRERSSPKYKRPTMPPGQFSASAYVSGVQKMASIRKECAEKAPRTSQYLARYQKECAGTVEHGFKKRQASCSRGGHERSPTKSSEADVAKVKPAASKRPKKNSR